MYRTETSWRLCGKCRNLKNHGLRGCHGWILACRLTQTPYKWMLGSTRRVRQPQHVYLSISVLSAQSVVNFIVAPVHGCFSSQSFWKHGSERSRDTSGLGNGAKLF